MQDRVADGNVVRVGDQDQNFLPVEVAPALSQRARKWKAESGPHCVQVPVQEQRYMLGSPPIFAEPGLPFIPV